MLHLPPWKMLHRGMLQETKRDFMCQLHEIVQLRTQHIAYVICTSMSGKFQKHNSKIKESLIQLLIARFVNIQRIRFSKVHIGTDEHLISFAYYCGR